MRIESDRNLNIAIPLNSIHSLHMMSRRPKLLLYGLLGLLLSFSFSAALWWGGANSRAAASPAAPQAVATPAFTLNQGVNKTVLDNGLTVLTKEIHTAPVAAVQVWYRVGSRNEAPGGNGISHQLEHLLFKGTKERPIQFGRLFSALGSQSNAFTSYDQTAYFGTVEREKLSALLVLEADRMQNALINSEQLNSEKRVVISEIQGYENSPSYRLNKAAMRAAFPNRNYGLPIGGTKADVEKFTVEQVRNYYRQYYSPDNAVLVIAGDFATEPTLKQVKEIFGKIPKQPKANSRLSPTPAPVPAATADRPPIVLKEPGSAAMLKAIYPLPDVKHPDVPAIDVMDAILTSGRSSRMYQALVETGLASSAGAYAAELIEPGWYSLAITAAAGQPLDKIDLMLKKVIRDLQEQQVMPEELSRAKVQLQSNFILGNQDVTSQASQLAYNQSVTGDYRYSDRYLAAVSQVTAADVQRVAQTYLQPQLRTVAYFEPTTADGKPGAASVGSSQIAENFSPGKPVDPAEVAKYLPKIQGTANPSQQKIPEELTLANGLRVLLLSDRSLPAVSLSGQIDAGTEYDIQAKAGIANLVASNLMNGTQSQDPLTLAKSLEDKGVNLGFGANREGVNISGSALSSELPVMMQTLADVLQNAIFPEEQLEFSRKRAITNLKMELDDPRRLGRRVLQEALYPENHPFHVFPTEASLSSITRADAVKFYRQHYRPETTAIALVGNFDPKEARSLLENSLGKWQATGEAPKLEFPQVPLPKEVKRLNQVIPGKTQTITYIGYPGINRQDPRYYAALLLNQILGGDTLSSRLGTEIRDRQGLTYGIYSAFAAGVQPGPFFISMQTAPEDAEKAIASTIALLKQLRAKGVTAAELSNAKRSITDSYPVELAHPNALAGNILSNAVYGLSREEISQFPKKIEAVTLAQVQQALPDLIRPDNLVIVSAGPGNTAAKN